MKKPEKKCSGWTGSGPLMLPINPAEAWHGATKGLGALGTAAEGALATLGSPFLVIIGDPYDPTGKYQEYGGS